MKDVEKFNILVHDCLHKRGLQMDLINSKRKNKLEEFFKLQDEIEEKQKELTKMYLED